MCHYVICIPTVGLRKAIALFLPVGGDRLLLLSKLYQTGGNEGIWEHGNFADIPLMPCQNDEMAKPEDTVKLVIGKELKIRFKSLCVQAETDMSSVARDLIDAWCEEQEKA